MVTVSTRILKDQLSSYLHRAEGGERIVVLRGGKPVAVLLMRAEATVVSTNIHTVDLPVLTRQADVLIALDQLVGASSKGLDVSDEERTVVVGSTSSAPTGEMITHPEIAMPRAESLSGRIADVSRMGHQHWADAAAITLAAFGDSVTANIFVVGMAFQAGALPVPADRILEAIGLNGVAVEENSAAFRLGRQYVVDPVAVAAIVDEAPSGEPEMSRRELYERELEAFGGRKCAEGFVGFVDATERRGSFPVV